MKTSTLVIVLLMSSTALAAVDYSANARIDRVLSFSAYGGGDVVFQINTPTSSCYGYWLPKSDPGFEGALSTILAAYQANTIVKVAGHDDQKWPGSSNFYCKLYYIELT